MFKNLNGQDCSKEEWLIEINKPEAIVGYKLLELNGAILEVYARYCGIDHEDGIFELGITGDENNAEHVPFHRVHKSFATREDCLNDYNIKVAAIEAVGGIEVIDG